MNNIKSDSIREDLANIRKYGKDVFSLLGELSCQFSNLEFMVSEILARLVSLENPFIVGLLSPDLNFNAKLDCIKKFAGIRLNSNPILKAEIVEFTKRARKTRKKRNLFIHGLWEMNEEKTKRGEIECLDSRWDIKEDKSNIRISHLQRINLKISDLEEHSVMIGDLVCEGVSLVNKIKKSNLEKCKVKNFDINLG